MDALSSAPSATPETPDETIRRLTAELREAREQQAATTEILDIINRSPGDLTPVFDAILEKAHSLCGADRGALVSFDGEWFRAIATRGMPEAFAEHLRRGFPFVLGRALTGGLLRGEPAHTLDLAAFAAESPPEVARLLQPALELAGTRTLLTVPLCKDGALLGYLAAYRLEVRSFTDKQIALLQNFAAQAVIAMENARLLTETREALEQQTATAEVLQVINSSPGDLAPVFDAMLEKAMRLCVAAFGVLWTFEGELGHAAAVRGVPPAFAQFLTQGPHRETSGTANSRLRRGEPVLQIADIADDDAYRSGDPVRQALVELGGGRTMLAVPLRRDDALLGSFIIYRQEVRAFTDKQIALLQNFAAQAVIAMENARLLTETQEALEQQTATAEVLQVINSSPGDLAPVFDAMLEKAMRLCEADYGHVYTFDGQQFDTAAIQGQPGFVEWRRQLGPVRPDPGHDTNLLARLMQGARLAHVADARQGSDYDTNPSFRELIDISGIRSMAAVALRKENTLLGAIVVYRREVRPFSDKQIALLQNFAAQAVIAMENARLINETREALEQQTATAEILRVIAGSAANAQPAFDAIAAAAVRLTGAYMSGLATYDGKLMHLAAMSGVTPEEDENIRAVFPIPADDGTVTGRAILTRQVTHIKQMPDSSEHSWHSYPTLARSGGQTVLAVPMLRDGVPVGAINVHRRQAEPFTDKQIDLFKSFADQAVIAMENARLIAETREALEQQTATAEVLQVINSSPGDLAPVFDAMLEKAIRLCGGSFGMMATIDGDNARTVADRDMPAEFRRYLAENPPSMGPDTFFGRAILERSIRHTSDMRREPAYREGQPLAVTAADAAGVRALLMAPLLKDDRVLGIFAIFRREAGPFSDKQIALLQNFAAQAVIAMENARPITETREALEQQTATAEVLQVINSSPGDLAPVFDAMLEKATRLCDAAFGVLHIYDGERFHPVSTLSVPGAYADYLKRGSPEFGPGTGPARILAGERVAHIVNMVDTEEYRAGEPNRRAIVDLGGARSALGVGLLKDDVVLGHFTIYRQQIRPFTDKQIALLENFAVQAVIAMENARLITETREALEQQTATAEVLQVINSSPGDLSPVFDEILEKARERTDAIHGDLWTYDGECFHLVATQGEPRFSEWLRQQGPLRPWPGSKLEDLLKGEDYVHLDDALQSASFQSAPEFLEQNKIAGIRTILSVPLRKEGVVLGLITVYRREVRPFSDKQIALLENFAAQAVIAMENARLLTETRRALEQQTATAEVLQVINSSPGDLAPVFDAILEKAHALCGAEIGTLFTYHGERFWPVAGHGTPPMGFSELMRDGFLPSPGNPFARMIEGERLVHIDDIRHVAAQRPDDPGPRVAAEGGIRTFLLVPLRKDNMLLGAISALRSEMMPFTDKQIGLLENFAAQAVIAMENARLLTETREALEQQTATAEVLQVINSSPGDLAPVFEAMLEKATRLCDAPFGTLRTWDGERFHFGGVYGDSQLSDWVRRRGSFRPDGGPLRRIMEGEQVNQVADALSDADYSTSPGFREMAEASGMRSVITVALRKDEALLGSIHVYRPEVRPFTDKQIALLQNFAAQAVIAMENARLLTETREALEQQIATAEVLQVINSSPGDLAPVFDAMLERAQTLCGADHGSLALYDGEMFRFVAVSSASNAFAERLREGGSVRPAIRSDSPSSTEPVSSTSPTWPRSTIPRCGWPSSRQARAPS